MTQTSVELIISIMDEVQLSGVSHHKSLSKKLINLIVNNKTSSNDKEKNLTFILRGCLDRVLLFPKNHATVERAMSFFCHFASSLEEDTMTTVFRHLCSRLKSTSKIVRQRCCELVSNILSQIASNDKELSCALIEELAAKLLPRLNDKIPIIRACALKALKFLQDAQNVEDPVTIGIKKVMDFDSAANVRLVAVETISFSEHTIDSIFARVRDIKSEVRTAAIIRLADIPIRQMSIQMRASLIKYGLTDREDKVRNVTKQLIMKWLASVDDNVPTLLKAINSLENEEVAQLLGTFIMEDLIKQDQHLSSDLKGSVKERYPKWNSNVSSISMNDILWIYIRCSYARNICKDSIASDICDSILPDSVVFCNLLNEAQNTPDIDQNVKKQFVLKYLIKTSSLIDKADISGTAQLQLVYKSILSNPNIPYELVDPTLKAYTDLDNDSSAAQDLINLSEEIRSTEINEDLDDDEILTILTERSLQIVNWTVKSLIGDTSSQPQQLSTYERITPFIVESLQQPDVLIRKLAISSLGLICMASEELCDKYRGILLQVASGDFDEESVRCEALQSLTDISLIYSSKYKDNNELNTTLVRLQESSGDDLMRLASESAAKLLYSGIMSDSRLFANLLKFFFLSNLSSEEDVNVDELQVGSLARLQQFLSLFFKSFMFSIHQCESIVLESIVQLVSDVINEMREGNLEVTSMQKIIRHLIGLCDNISMSNQNPDSNDELNNTSTSNKQTMEDSIRERLLASISREILKMGNNKWVDKTVIKELVKIIPSVCIGAWITVEKSLVIINILETIVSLNQFDKASLKHLEKAMIFCKGLISSSPTKDISNTIGSEFMQLAPGLADLLELNNKSLDSEQASPSSPRGKRVLVNKRVIKNSYSADAEEAEDDIESYASDMNNAGNKKGVVNKRLKKQTSYSDVSDDIEDEEDDIDTNNGANKKKAIEIKTGPVRSSMARSSKLTASQKISNQLSQESNMKYNANSSSIEMDQNENMIPN